MTTAQIQGGDLRQQGGTVAVANTSTATKTVLDMPMDQAWLALDQAYAVLTIAPSERNASTHLLGNTSFKARRKLGDVRLMNALDCGGESSAPNAESYDITMSVRSQLTPNPAGGTLLQSFVEGVGRNATTNNSNPVTCYSRGGIEKRIDELVRTASAEKGKATVIKKPPTR